MKKTVYVVVFSFVNLVFTTFSGNAQDTKPDTVKQGYTLPAYTILTLSKKNTPLHFGYG
ncbi:MAG TPA: hypothetical protein VNS50_06355 [Ginsengibacter sp.]|nr:hypothetical protein [Ginsengibacter sp.]